MSSSLNSTLDSMEACSSEWRANSEVYISADGACTHNDMLNGLCKASPCEEEASLPTEPVPSSRHASTIMESNHVSDMSNINTNTINISVKNDHIVTSESTLVELSPQSRLSVSLHDRAVDGSENENDNQTADEENDNEENYCADEESESEVAEVTQTRAPSTHVVFGPPGEAGDTSPIAANSTDPMEEQPVDHVFSNYFRLSPESSKQRWVSNYHHASLALDSGRLLSHAIGVVGAYDAAAETTTTTATTTAAGGSGVAPWRQPSDTLQGWSEMCSGGCSLRRNVTGSHILLITEENTVLEEPMLSASCANCLLLRSTLCLPHGRSEACFSAQLQPQRCSSTKSATGSGQASLTYLGMGFTARVNEELRGFHMVLAQLHWDGTATVSVGVWRVTERDAVVELRVVCPPQLVRLSHDRLQLRLVAREGEFDVFVNEKRLSDAAVSMPGLRLKEARALLFNTGGAVAVRNIALSQGDRPPESRVFASPMYNNNNSNNSNNCSNLNVSFISSSNVQVGAKCESPEHTHTLSPGSNNNSNNNNNNSSNNVSRTLSRNSSQPHACGNSSSTMNWCASRKTRPIAVGAPGICRNSPSRLCTPGNSPPTRMSAQNLAGLQRSMSGGSRAVSLGAKKHSDPCSLMHGPLIGSSVTELGSAVCRPSTCDVGAPLRECFSGVVSSPAVTMPRRGTQPPPPSRPSVSGGLPEGRGESAGGPGDVLHRSPTHTRRSSIGGTSVGGSATAALSQNSPQRSVERAAVPHARHRGRAAEAECTDANTVQDTRHRPASSLRSPAPNENHSARMTGSGQQASTHTTNNSPSCKPHPARSCSRLSPPLSSQHAHNNTTTNNNNGDDNNNKQQRHASKSAAAAPSRRSGAARSSPLPRRSQDTSDVLPAHIDPALAAVIRAEIMERSPQVSWDDIAGIADAKRLLKEAVLLPIMLPELFVGVVQPWRGVLLYGPPGTGKTMLAKAVATSANTTFFSISASTLNTKHYGESEKLVRTLFQLARHYAPSTIFFDEVDALASARGGNEHEASRRVKSEMLQQMDGLHDHDNASSNNSSNSRSVQRSSAGSTLGRGSGAGSGVSSRNSPVRATYQTHGINNNNNNNNNELLTPEMDGSALPLPRSQPLSAPQEQQNQRVLVLATTNRPWDLDEAIRRRLEKRIYIPLPDAVSRRAMLDRYVTHLRLADDVVMDRVVEQTEGYSGADVAIVVRDAAMMPVRRLIDAYSTEEIAQLKAKGCLHVSEVCMADFDAALSRAQSSVAKESLKQFEQWTASFGST